MTFAVVCSRKVTGSFTCISKVQPCEPTWRGNAERRRGAPLRAVKREARPGGYSPPRSSRFEQKAAECRQLADNAQHAETRQIYVRLVLSYERLAEQAEQSEGKAAAD